MHYAFRTFLLMAVVAVMLTAPANGWTKGKKLEAEAPLVATENASLGASGEIDFRLKGKRVDLKIEIEDEGSIENGSVDVIFHASVHHNWMGPNVLTIRYSWH